MFLLLAVIALVPTGAAYAQPTATPAPNLNWCPEVPQNPAPPQWDSEMWAAVYKDCSADPSGLSPRMRHNRKFMCARMCASAGALWSSSKNSPPTNRYPLSTDKLQGAARATPTLSVAHAPNPLPENPIPGWTANQWALLRNDCQRLYDKAATGQRLNAADESVSGACRSVTLQIREFQEGSLGNTKEPGVSGPTPLAMPSFAPTPSSG